jgi:hypothetical protein
MANENALQRKLLKSGILDNLGSYKDLPLELNTVESIFVKYMGRMILEMNANLNKEKPVGIGLTSSSVATGALSESIRFEYKRLGSSYVGEIFMLDYADYVDKGVKGVAGAKPTNYNSPYQFKTIFPSKDMQKALLIWVRRKNIYDKAASPIGLFRAATRKTLASKTARDKIVIAIGIGIKTKGTDQTLFKTNAVGNVLAEMRAELAKAAAHDIVINIKDSF